MDRDEILLEFGARVRSLHESSGWSEGALGDRARSHRSYLNSTEQEQVNPSFSNLLCLAAAIGIDPGGLWRGLGGVYG